MFSASVEPVTPSRVRTATPLKQTKADTQGKSSPKKTLEPMRDENGLENSTRQKVKLVLRLKISLSLDGGVHDWYLSK